MEPGVNGAGIFRGAFPLAGTNNFATATTLGCCVYPMVGLNQIPKKTISNNGFNLGLNVYGVVSNINFTCTFPCPPNVLIPVPSTTKTLNGVEPKIRIGDNIGFFGSVIIGTPTNTLIS